MALRWRIRSLPNLRIMRACFRFIGKLNRWHALAFLSITFVLGQILNYHAPFGKFLVYQLLFLPAIVYAFVEIQNFAKGVEEYRTITASHPSRESGDYAQRLIDSNWAVPGILIVGSLYVYSTITLGYVRFNITGYYALFVIVLIMSSSVLGQTCYVYYLLFLRRILKSSGHRYNFYFPTRTDWVQLISRMGTRLNNAFFILGFVYTFVYFLNMPSQYISVSTSPLRVTLSTPNDLVFVVTWIVIFLVIILAFPVYAWLTSIFLKAIVEKLKNTSVAEIEALMRQGEIGSIADVDAELKYYQLISHIEASAKKPRASLKYLPAVATLSSIAVHVIKISESLSP